MKSPRSRFPLILLALALPLGAQTIIHVDAGANAGARDGSSWQDAYLRLQDALAAAVAPAEIWVVRGTYRPNEDFVLPPTAPDDSFVIPAGISIYGGFDGLEGLREQRDPAANPVILSGDLLGDDTDLGGGTWTGLTENSRHVLTVSSGSPVIDGVTITAGNASSGGGGILITGGSPQFVNCTIRRNTSATNGGGVAASGNPTFTRCRFLDNVATGSGGGIRVLSGTAVFNDCRFEGNDAGSNGGGLATAGATVSLDDCEFRMNDASSSGGAVFFDTTSGGFTADGCLFESNTAGSGGAVFTGVDNPVGDPLSLANSRFVSNSAGLGGALYLSGINSRSVEVQSCEFTGNQSVTAAGGVYVADGSGLGLLFDDCVFRGNSKTASGSGGGAVCLFQSSTNAPFTTFRDCAFQGNQSGGGGGAVFITGPVTRLPAETFINCSFQGNNAAGSGGAIGGSTGSILIFGSLNLRNCIIWNNRSAGSTSTSAASIGGPSLSAAGDHNLIHNRTATGTGSLDGTLPANDPLFISSVDPATAPHVTGDLRLSPGSPVLDIGQNTHNASPTDVANFPRIANTTIDFGAHEALPGPEVVVRRSGGAVLASGEAIELGLIRLEDGHLIAAFEVENAGLATLASLSVGAGGPSGGSTTLVQPAASLDAYQTTSFEATVALSASGPLSLTLSLASNDADENPFVFTLTGIVSSDLLDSDNDGISDYQEILSGIDPNHSDSDGDGVLDGTEIALAALGFREGVDDSALLAVLQSNSTGVGLFTETNLQSLALGRPVISRDPLTGNFTITTGILQSPDLGTTPFAPLIDYIPTYNPGTGDLLLEFPPPSPDAHFFQIFGGVPSP